MNPRTVAIGAMLVLTAVTAGYTFHLWHRGAFKAPAAGPSPGSGAASAVFGESNPIPQTLPSFSLHDRDGKLRSIDEWKGKSLVINFWATWCEPCRKEIPLLKQLHAERASQGTEVIGIAMDFRDKVLKYAEEIGMDYTLLIGEQDAMDAADAMGASNALPVTVFTDSQGRIVTLYTGELNAAEAGTILDAVAGINRGTLTLEQARTAISH